MMTQILVLGMHRAGTSVTAGLIHRMGAYFSDPAAALPPDDDNPKGFYERRDVLACNQELLRLSGCVWHAPHRWAAPEIPPALWQRMGDIIGHLNAHSPFVLKDPRLCLTLPCWRGLIDQPVIVLAHRDPREIAQSLYLRNAMPIDYGLALWEFHAAHALRAAYGLNVVYASHADLMQNPTAATLSLFESLLKAGARDLMLPPSENITEFVTPALQRARPNTDMAILNPFQEMLCAMGRGEMPIDPGLAPSPQAVDILRRLAGSVSGSPRA